MPCAHHMGLLSSVYGATRESCSSTPASLIGGNTCPFLWVGGGERGCHAAWLKETGCFLSSGSQSHPPPPHPPTSAVLRKAPGSSETDSDRKGQEAHRPELGGPRYLVALGVVLYPELRHAGVHTCGQCGVWIAKTKKQTMVTETSVVPAHPEKQT